MTARIATGTIRILTAVNISRRILRKGGWKHEGYYIYSSNYLGWYLGSSCSMADYFIIIKGNVMKLTHEQLLMLDKLSIDEIREAAHRTPAEHREKVREEINRVCVNIRDLKTSIERYKKSRRIKKKEKTQIIKSKNKNILRLEYKLNNLKIELNKNDYTEKAKAVWAYIMHESEKINEWRRKEAIKRQRQTMGGQGALSSYIGSGLRKDLNYEDRQKLDEVGEYRLRRALERYKIAPQIVL